MINAMISVIDVGHQADLDVAMEKLANEDVKGVRPTLKDEVCYLIVILSRFDYI